MKRYRVVGFDFDTCVRSFDQVRFWQDDGQDEAEANEVWGGPNGTLSLAQARENFRTFGAVEERFVSKKCSCAWSPESPMPHLTPPGKATCQPLCRRVGWLCPGVAEDSRCVHESRVQTMGAAPATIERYKNVCASS